jgi:hypothetical protein
MSFKNHDLGDKLNLHWVGIGAFSGGPKTSLFLTPVPNYRYAPDVPGHVGKVRRKFANYSFVQGNGCLVARGIREQYGGPDGWRCRGRGGIVDHRDG